MAVAGCGTAARHLAIANGNHLRVVDADTGEAVHDITRYSEVMRLAYRPDGERLAGHRSGADWLRGGISIFSFRSRRFERLTEFGMFPVWLHDQRRLLFQSEGKIYLLDSLTGTTREFLSSPPNEAGAPFAISPDGRTLYFALSANEADVWLMSLP